MEWFHKGGFKSDDTGNTSLLKKDVPNLYPITSSTHLICIEKKCQLSNFLPVLWANLLSLKRKLLCLQFCKMSHVLQNYFWGGILAFFWQDPSLLVVK